MEQLLKRYEELERQEAQIKQDKDALKKVIMLEMKKNNLDKFKGDVYEPRIQESYTRYSFDANKFKEKYLDLYNDYTKETEVKEQLVMAKVRKKADDSI